MMTALFEVGCIGACAGAVLHSARSRGWGQTLALFALPFLVGWAAELISLLWVHSYFYPANAYHLWLPGGFPLAIACGWALTCYMGFLVMRRFNSFRLSVLAGAGIDAVLEPMALYWGLWVWTVPGPYFGAPVGNALGWLGIVALVLWIIRRWRDERG